MKLFIFLNKKSSQKEKRSLIQLFNLYGLDVKAGVMYVEELEGWVEFLEIHLKNEVEILWWKQKLEQIECVLALGVEVEEMWWN